MITMKTKNIFPIIIIALLLVMLLASLSFAQEERKIRMKEYTAQLADWQNRETTAKNGIAKEQASIDSLKKVKDDLDSQINSQWDEIYAMLGTDRAGVQAYRNNLAGISNQIDGLNALTPEELFQKRDEIKAIEDKIAEAKKDKIYLLSEMQDKVAALEGKLVQLKNRMPKSLYDNYTVVRGDYLWKISKKPNIYNDPMQWMKIYTYNREMIKNPDLIYPNWILKICRQTGPNEYLVVKCDFLKKIAANPQVLGDPTKWTKLYEANKSVIANPNLLYPYQILVVPK